MKHAVSKYKIRYFYPAIISLIVILISTITLIWSINVEEKKAINNEINHVRESVLFSRGVINEFINKKDYDKISGIIDIISSFDNFLVFFIENPQGEIIISSDAKFNLSDRKKVLNQLGIPSGENISSGTISSGKYIISSEPLTFGAEQGKLWLIHDFGHTKNSIVKREFQRILGFVVILLLGFFAISFLLYYSATVRLDYIRNSFLDFGRGKRGLIFKVPGNDEISEIGEALHEMSLLVEKEENLLIQKEKILTEMVGNLQGIAYKCNDYGGRNISFISQGCVFLTGYTADDFTKSRSVSFEKIMEKDEYLKMVELVKIQLEKTGKYEVEYKIKHKDGSFRWVMDKGSAVFESKKLVSREGFAVDITNSKEIELKILERDKTINQYIEIIDSYVLTSKTNPDGIITYVSDAFSKLTGYSREELIGKKHNILRHPEMQESFYENMWKVLKSGTVWRGEIKNKNKNGDDYWVDVCITPTLNQAGVVTEFTAVSEDISDRKKIEEIAITDELTGLFNRRFFNQTMPRELNRAVREKRKFVFVMADVDYFKKYNDNYGHQKGDEVLTAIGKTVQNTFRRSGDFGFRLGGEEFGIFWHADDYEGVVRIVSIFRSAVEQLGLEHLYSEIGNKITISIGVCLCQDIYKQEEVYKNADEALYEAKHSGRNQIKYRSI
jgi:diguanylate cyclase (GGDEF)-like protein/PAS domain S-box-containing protein